MLRNAEYVLALQDVLKLAPTGRTPAQLRAAFSRVDTDNSGYIDADEVQNLFDDVYGDLPDTASTAEINDLKQRKKAELKAALASQKAEQDFSDTRSTISSRSHLSSRSSRSVREAWR